MKWLVIFTLIALLLAGASGAAGRHDPQERASTPQRPEGGDQLQQVPKGLQTNGPVERVPPNPREVCGVCDKPVKSSDLVYLVDGESRCTLGIAMLRCALTLRNGWCG